MDIFSIEFENWYSILFRINWISVIILIASVIAIVCIIKKAIPFINRKSFSFDGMDVGIGKSVIRLKINNKDREIAYRIWVEMKTRAICNSFDEENDVIVEVYDSLYKFFQITRDAIKDVPVEKLKYSEELISLTEEVLNKGLRPHLTKWQAKFRKWYINEAENNSDKTPQEIQKAFPEYDSLLSDLIITNQKMINYGVLMEKIAFNKK